MSKKYYIYKYVIDEDIIYIGLSERDLQYRLYEHSIEEKFLPYIPTAKIYYFTVKNKTEMKIMEKLLIDKYTPILNDKDKYDETINIEFTEPKWSIYKPRKKQPSQRPKMTIDRAEKEEKLKEKVKNCISRNSLCYEKFIIPLEKRINNKEYLVKDNEIHIPITKEEGESIFEHGYDVVEYQGREVWFSEHFHIKICRKDDNHYMKGDYNEILDELSRFKYNISIYYSMALMEDFCVSTISLDDTLHLRPKGEIKMITKASCESLTVPFLIYLQD